MKHSYNTDTLQQDTLSAALEYSRRGWLVFPVAWITTEGICSCREGSACQSPGKHPLTPRGFYDASRDENTIRAWWRRFPQANVAIRTGRESNLLVLDVDPRKGGDKSLERLIKQFGPLPDTLWSATGGGGWHFYFQYPGPIRLHNNVPGFPGLDIKGDGGYVVAPPSCHESGKHYEWKTYE